MINKHLIAVVTVLFLCTQWVHAEPPHAPAQGQNIIYVDLNANGNNDGSDWNNAFTGVQAAVDAAVSGDEIHIAEGLYQAGTDITINKPLTLMGGFPTGGGAQDWDSHPTLLDGDQSHRVITATHTSNTLKLVGLTIQNGFFTNPTFKSRGGGIESSTGDLEFEHVIIRDNQAFMPTDEAYGGGVYGKKVVLKNTHIINNTAVTERNLAYGGGVYGFDVTVIDSTVENNSAEARSDQMEQSSVGGGIFTVSSVTIINTLIMNNHAKNVYLYYNNHGCYVRGGGVASLHDLYMSHSTVKNNSIYCEAVSVSGRGGGISARNMQINNSVITGNRCETNYGETESCWGGGIFTYSHPSELTCQNCLITNNHVVSSSEFNSRGGGVYGAAVLFNSIVWGNIADNDAVITSSEHIGSSLSASHTLIKDQFPAGTNNIDATAPGFDPMFVDAVGNNFRLAVGSPLIDAGDFMSLPADVHDLDNDGDVSEGVPFDLDGVTRVLDAEVDIGAYEHHDLIFTHGFD